MRKYETVFVISPNSSEQETNDIVSSLEQVLTGGKGTLIKTDRWGKRKTAYPVEKFNEGQYVLFFYDAEGPLVKELERKMRMNEKIIRFLTVKAVSDQMPIRPTDADFYPGEAGPRADARRPEREGREEDRHESYER